MSNERKCQAGCGHPLDAHIDTCLTLSPYCSECLNADTPPCHPNHPFDTIESLRAEVEALTAERDEAVAIIESEFDIDARVLSKLVDLVKSAADNHKSIIDADDEAVRAYMKARDEASALRQIALTDEACESVAPELIEIVQHSYALDIAGKVSKAIRAKRGV